MFTSETITIAGLAKITLPGRTLLLCDGGMVRWGGETYFSEDVEFGTIGAFGLQPDGLGGLAPGGQLTFIPASGAAAAALANPAFQNSRMQFWLAEMVRQTGFVVGSPVSLFDGLLKTATIRSARGTRRVEIPFVSRADRLFRNNQGNVCSDSFHQSVWPGELGLVNATGVPTTRAFGIEGPPRSSATYGVTGGGGARFGFEGIRLV
jgi:hypothetical protein